MESSKRTLEDCVNFFTTTREPDDFQHKKSQIEDFVQKHRVLGNRIVLVSSGGTTVPLESRTVRFIDNFSVGTRGSASTEYFLQNGYAVLFLHRSRSLAPYSRHFSRLSPLDLLEFDSTDASSKINVKEGYQSSLVKQLCAYQKVQEEGTLLTLDFTTLGEYIHLLRASCYSLHSLGASVVLYLAAAVSDFYIPKDQMPEHKIQSSDGALQISLQLVPKMLEPLVKDWVPSAFIVSFKLETNNELLISKSRQALEKYKHQLVIANILETRKEQVIFVTRNGEETVLVSAEEISVGLEVESKIIPELIKRHEQFLKC